MAPRNPIPRKLRDKPSRHPNRTEKRALSAAAIAIFMQQVGRKAQKGIEPNDRKYDHEFAKKIRRLSPTELDRLMHDDEDE